MASTQKREDRRIQRTRRVLQQAFKEAVQEQRAAGQGVWGVEKSFAALSVQEIAARANVNRGTFYLHFADKYMLAEAVMREQFQQMLRAGLPPAPRWNRQSLQQLIQVVLESFENKYQHQRRASLGLVPLLERTMHEELTALLLCWLRQEERVTRGLVPPETIAEIVGWTIFGPALQWSQEESPLSQEQMARAILQVVLEGTARLAPTTQPE